MNGAPPKRSAHDGELKALIQARDWTGTPLGPVSGWPSNLRTAVDICLNSRFPTIVLWGPDFITLYNDDYAPLLGSKHPSALGRPFRDIWPEAWGLLGPMMDGVASTGVPTWSEDQPVPLLRKGFLEECFFTFSFAQVTGESGASGGIFSTVVETTERVIGERRMRMLRELGEASPGARTVEDAYTEAARVLARTPADLTFALLYHLEDDERARLVSAAGVSPAEALSPAVIGLGEEDALWPLARVRHGRGTELVTRFPPRVGTVPGGAWPEPTQAALVVPLLRPGQERPEGFLVAGLSPRRAFDEAYRTFLELAAGQIAAGVASARAYEAERRRAEALAELDEAKTAFFSNVSHEFRTPLTLMLGPLADALVSPEKALAGEGLETVTRNSERLLRLVNSLLEFSRVEAGRVEAAYEPTDLATLTAGLASSFRFAVEHVALTLTVDCPPLSQPVYVDRDMWEKVVLNLVSNAFKFTLEGGITVRLRETAGHAVLEVSDTGTGIPAHELTHLFGRFHRVRGARSRTHEGTGIGLALVQELVKLHGGTIDVESQVDRGTRFTVSLPLGSAHLPAEQVQGAHRPVSVGTGSSAYVQEALRWQSADLEQAPPPAASPATGGAVGPASASRVLVVDDNADLRDYLRRVLSPHFHVETAVDGLAALEAVRRRPPDVIVSDVMMPRLDGVGLIQRLREDPGTRATPIILLSARAGPEATVGGLEAGADDYLVKPFAARELVARVRSNLELARMRREVFRREAREAQLVEAVQARDEFLSVVSHELKTPLTRFLLQMDLLERDLDARARARIEGRLGVAGRTVRRLASLVDTLLDVSHINSGRLELRMDAVALHPLVAEAITAARDEAGREGSTILFEGEDSLVGTCDRARIGQVVTHLLSNAVKFGLGRPVEVNLKGVAGAARLTVTDHGIGIAPEHRARIFERFERAVSARNYSGFGLGLWVARQLVVAHCGHITVTETPGGGSTFTVELPLDSRSPHPEKRAP